MIMDWIWGLLGGLMIGAAGAVYLLGNGRIMGASGIIGRIVDAKGSQAFEAAAFVAAMIAVPAVIALIWLPGTETHLTSDWLIIAVAGLLVGLGTRIANGCTSGHGVCGMSRLSPRGIVATLVFMASGIVSVALFRHVLEII
ncbi:YeeE/YedE family protein [Heliomarina baculiformis]|uniref:YeeE/YedE family protein n=1 Tax=Heliomarina baculiformis TaxID=2872036 RepID=UPI001EE25CB0|nr:YeeE/YedE thiosulfate transporter family protein [Heliomarina baculiformis]